MNKFMRWILWIPLGAILVLFLVANRAPVSISLDPISAADPALATPPLPLWFWLVLFLLGGVFLGAAGFWISGRGARAKARADRRDLRTLKKKVAAEPSSPPTSDPT